MHTQWPWEGRWRFVHSQAFIVAVCWFLSILLTIICSLEFRLMHNIFSYVTVIEEFKCIYFSIYFWDVPSPNTLGALRGHYCHHLWFPEPLSTHGEETLNNEQKPEWDNAAVEGSGRGCLRPMPEDGKHLWCLRDELLCIPAFRTRVPCLGLRSCGPQSQVRRKPKAPS